MMAVCGIGSPRGLRNSATTAYQSASPPMVAASANAATKPKAGCRCSSAFAATNSASVPASTKVASALTRRNSAARATSPARVASLEALDEKVVGMVMGSSVPHPEERPLGRVSKDEALWFETAQERLLTMRRDMDRVPDAVQRSSRCSAEPGPKNLRLSDGPRISSAPRRKGGALHSIRGTPICKATRLKKKARLSGPSNERRVSRSQSGGLVVDLGEVVLRGPGTF